MRASASSSARGSAISSSSRRCSPIARPRPMPRAAWCSRRREEARRGRERHDGGGLREVFRLRDGRPRRRPRGADLRRRRLCRRLRHRALLSRRAHLPPSTKAPARSSSSSSPATCSRATDWQRLPPCFATSAPAGCATPISSQAGAARHADGQAPHRRQAPGMRVHKSGVSFKRSVGRPAARLDGRRSRDVLRRAARVNIAAMAFLLSRLRRGGRRQAAAPGMRCDPGGRRLYAARPPYELTLLVGRHAQLWLWASAPGRP